MNFVLFLRVSNIEVKELAKKFSKWIMDIHKN